MDRLLRSAQANRAGEDHKANQRKLAEGAIVEVVEATHLSGYKLKLRFSDKTEQVIDFERFLTTSRNPMIRECLARQKFKSFRIDHGDLVWGDYDLCFPIADLYEGSI